MESSPQGFYTNNWLSPNGVIWTSNAFTLTSHEAQSWLVRNNVDAIEMDLDSGDARTPKRGPFPRVSKIWKEMELANFAAEIRSAPFVNSRDRPAWSSLSVPYSANLLVLPSSYYSYQALSHSRCRHSRNDSYAILNYLLLYQWDSAAPHKSGRLHCISGICLTLQICMLLLFTYLETSDVGASFCVLYILTIVFRGPNSVSPES